MSKPLKVLRIVILEPDLKALELLDDLEDVLQRVQKGLFGVGVQGDLEQFSLHVVVLLDNYIDCFGTLDLRVEPIPTCFDCDH